MQFPCRSPGRGGFSGRVWKQEGTRGGGPERGERGHRGRGLPAGSGRGGAGRRWDRAAAPWRTCCRPGAGVPASAARPSIVAAAGEGGRGGPGGVSPSRFPRAGAQRGLNPPRGEACKPLSRGRPGWGEGRPRCPRGAGTRGEGRRDLGPLTPDRQEARGRGGGELCSWGGRARGELAHAGPVEAPSRRASRRAPGPSSRARGPARGLRRPIPAGALLRPGRGHLLVLPATGLSLPEAAAGHLLGPRFANRNSLSTTGPKKGKMAPNPTAGESF